MNARIAKEEIALLMPTTLSHYADEPRLDGAPARSGLSEMIAGAVRWMVELPRRRTVLAELHELSDHELADIGLNRSELHRVFDPAFAAARTRDRDTLGRALLG